MYISVLQNRFQTMKKLFYCPLLFIWLTYFWESRCEFPFSAPSVFAFTALFKLIFCDLICTYLHARLALVITKALQFTSRLFFYIYTEM